MKLKQIKSNFENINLIKTETFKTITVKFTFIKEFKKEYIPLITLLGNMLIRTNKKYKTRTEITKKLEYLYNSDIFCKSTISGGLYQMECGLDFICPKYTEMSMYESVFNMLNELLFNPNIENEAFDEKEFDINKQNIIATIKNLKEQNTVVAESNYNKIMFKNTPYENSPLSLIHEYEKITSKSLYSFYKELLFNSKLIVTVVGDFDEERILKNIRKITKKLKTNDLINLSTELKELSVKKTIEKTDKKSFNQSTLLMGYILNNLTEFERKYVLVFYNLLLGNMNNSVLFINVREKNSLCYNISSYVHKYIPSLTIECGINRQNYKKALKVIKDSVLLMSDEKVIEKNFENALNTINLSLNDYYEDIDKIATHYVMCELEKTDDIETRRQKFSEITVSDIVNLNKKMKLNVIYFLEGVNEKN